MINFHYPQFFRIVNNNPVEAKALEQKNLEEGHSEAEKSIAQIEENRIERLSYIFSIIDENKFRKEDESTQDKMPVILQRAIVNFIMEDKQKNDPESLTITLYDITTVLDHLAEYIADPDSSKMNTLARYRKQDVAALLQDGVDEYNQEEKTSIQIVIQDEISTPKEMWRHLGQYMLMKSSSHLTASQEKQRDNKINKILADSWIGKNIGNGTPLTAEQLAGKKLTVYHYLCDKEVQELIDRFFDNNCNAIADMTIPTARALKDEWVRSHIDDGQLEWQQLDKLSEVRSKVLCDTEVQKFLDQGYGNIKQVGSLSDHAANALQNDWVRKSITDGGLKWEHLVNLSKTGSKVLCDAALRDTEWQELVLSSIDKFDDSFSEHIVIALQKDWVRESITCSELKWQSLANLSSGGSKVLCDAELLGKEWQGLILENIDQVVKLSDWAANALRSDWVRDHFSNNWQQLVNLKKGGSELLCYENAHEFLEENWNYMDQIVSLSEPAAIALKNDWVRDRFFNNWQQLTNLTEERRRVLCDRKVQDFLGRNQERIDQVIGLSKEAANALRNDSVRARIADWNPNWEEFVELAPEGIKNLLSQC